MEGAYSKWVKIGKAKLSFMGRHHVCVTSGCFLVFINIETEEEIIYCANNYENGEGIDCFDAHSILPVFAFAELCAKPRLLVKTFPDFETITTCQCIEGYSNLTFTTTDYLVSLGKYPFFTLIVWNWRKGEMLVSVISGLTIAKQSIRCSKVSPIVIAQIGIASTKLRLWTLHVCGKKHILKRKDLRVDRSTIPFSNFYWHSDGTLFVLDIVGNVYTVTSDHVLQQIITWPSQSIGKYLTFLTWYKGGLLITGSDGKLLLFKKQQIWTEVEEFKTDIVMKRFAATSKDVLVGVSHTRQIVLYNPEEKKFKNIKDRDSRFSEFCFIFPVGEFVITLSQLKFLSVWEVETGKPRGRLDLTYDNPLALTENPVYPYVGVAFESGIFKMISVYDPDKLLALTTIHLTRKPLDKIFFHKNGKLMVVGGTASGELFVLEGYPGIRVTVEAYIDVGQTICDFILIPSRTCMRIFVLLCTSVNYKSGNRFMRYCFVKGRNDSTAKEFVLEEDMHFRKIYPTDKENRDRVFYAVPFDSKFLYELETKRGDSALRIINKINLGHQLRSIKLKFINEYMISYGYDGLVIIRKIEDLSPFCVIMPHHRKNGGVLRANLSPQLSHVVSLGLDNVFCCTKLNVLPVNKEKIDELNELLLQPKMQLMFTKSKPICLPIEHPGTTWLEERTLLHAEKERKACHEERSAIWSEFKAIQKEVSKLLDINLAGPENEKIPIRYFDMDEDLTMLRSREYDDVCRQTAEELELLMEAQSKVARWLKTNYWDKMTTKGKAIWGVFNNLSVENYPLLAEDPILKFFVQCIEEYRKIEDSIAAGHFLAWERTSKSQLDMRLQEEPYIKDEKETFLETLKDEEEEERDEEDLETFTAFAGSVTHMFIKKSPYHYPQTHIHSHVQIDYETLLNLYENSKLKQLLNKQFDDLMTQKEREMKLIRERNERLRYILAELNFFNVEKWGLERINIIPTDPEWHPTELPETIMTVTDDEVSILPYVSPSEQALIDARAAEEERIRLALLADDFRERALMKMMNGVLEMRWEDEIKKDVPKPKCMLDKNPEEFNEDDLRAVRDYEEKVKQLVADREYYKLLLEIEYGKLCNTLREGIRKFNGRLDDFLLIKIKIETAILHERLKADIIRKKSLQKIYLNEEEANIQKQIQENEREVDEILRYIPIIYENVQECRSEIDAIAAKEKTMEKNFKKDFQNVSPVVMEQANRQMKRRPKTNIRNVSATILLELAKCVAANYRSTLLNLSQDSVDYMKALDAIDMYVGIPSAIDEHTYAKICQYRRLRIEIELREKANSIDVLEGENTLHTYKKLLETKREQAGKLRADLDRVRTAKLDSDHDNEIMMVLKQGLVELPLTGDRSDFDNAILITKKEIDTVNRIIVKNGARKLRAMRQNMEHHRAILLMEWEHTRLRMTVEDFKEHLKDINSVNVTKDMQSYLKAMSRGYTPEGTLSFEEELERLTQSYERMLNERKDKVLKIQHKIKAIKSDNKKLDQEISSINIDICEYQVSKDDTLEEKEKEVIRIRMSTLIKRANLVKQLQDYHNKILMLQTELELLRLRTYPTLKYKILS